MLPGGLAVIFCAQAVVPSGQTLMPFGQTLMPCGQTVIPCRLVMMLNGQAAGLIGWTLIPCGLAWIPCGRIHPEGFFPAAGGWLPTMRPAAPWIRGCCRDRPCWMRV